MLCPSTNLHSKRLFEDPDSDICHSSRTGLTYGVLSNYFYLQPLFVLLQCAQPVWTSLAFGSIPGVNKCYHLNPENLVWSDAVQKCRSVYPEAHAVGIYSDADQEAVTSYLSSPDIYSEYTIGIVLAQWWFSWLCCWLVVDEILNKLTYYIQFANEILFHWNSRKAVPTIFIFPDNICRLDFFIGYWNYQEQSSSICKFQCVLIDIIALCF